MLFLYNSSLQIDRYMHTNAHDFILKFLLIYSRKLFIL